METFVSYCTLKPVDLKFGFRRVEEDVEESRLFLGERISIILLPRGLSSLGELLCPFELLKLI